VCLSDMSGATTSARAFEADHRDTVDGDQEDVPSSLNRDCLCHITGQLALADLLTATRLNRAYRDAAGARATSLWPMLEPLLAAPFRLSRRDLLVRTELRLADHLTGDAQLRALCAACAVSGVLAAVNVLDLSYDRISEDGMADFASALASGALPSCTRLDLCNNQIGDKGLEAFASACAGGAMASASYINLACNGIGDKGVKAFAAALAMGGLADCKKLILMGNSIGDMGLTALAEALAGGALASLEEICTGGEMYEGHPALTAACRARGVRLFQE